MCSKGDIIKQICELWFPYESKISFPAKQQLIAVVELSIETSIENTRLTQAQ